MILLLVLSLVTSLRLDEKKKFILSWIKRDLDVSAFFADDHVDSTSVLIVNVNQVSDTDDNTDAGKRKHGGQLNLGILPYHSTKDLCKFYLETYSVEIRVQVYEKVREVNRDFYRASHDYISSDTSPYASSVVCKSKKFTGNPFMGQREAVYMRPIMYSSVHGKCGMPLKDMTFLHAHALF